MRQNQYGVVTAIGGERDEDLHYPSLDHYMVDDDILTALGIITEGQTPRSWATTYPDLANIFFNPARNSFPRGSSMFGFPEPELSAFNHPETSDCGETAALNCQDFLE